MVSIADFHKVFLEAEEEIKFAELTVDCLTSVENDHCESICEPRGVVIPSINELRYAAKHVSIAMQSGVSEKDQEEQLRRAVRHCVRAKLDALKAVVLFFARDFYRFSSDYRLLHVDADDRNQLNEYRQKIWSVLSLLSKNRSENIEEICDTLKNSIEELHKIYLQVTAYRGKFNQLLRQGEEREKKAERRGKIDRWIGIIGALFGLAGVIGLFIQFCQ